MLIISVALNLVLGLAAWHLSRKPLPQNKLVAASQRVTVVSSAGSGIAIQPATNTVAVITNRFRWRQLESEDYAQYVANLRKVGCPEKTIRDIVVADLEKV